MRKIKLTKNSILMLLFFFMFSNEIYAQIIVHGGGTANECYINTKVATTSKLTAINVCYKALKEPLSKKNRAATHVNLGILLMRRGEYLKAQEQYTKAALTQPKLSEIYINLAASRIYTTQYKLAVEAATKAIKIGTEKLPEALYNRAIAYDSLGFLNRAFEDLALALEIRPDWPPAKNMITKYDKKNKITKNK